MTLSEIKTSGKICIFLQKVPTITIEEYKNKAEANYYNAMNESGFRFYSLFLKQKKELTAYPMISEEDFRSDTFEEKYKLRFDRLKKIADSLYYYSLKITSSDSSTVMEYAKQEGSDRVVIFISKHLQRDEKRLLKMIELEMDREIGSNLIKIRYVN